MLRTKTGTNGVTLHNAITAGVVTGGVAHTSWRAQLALRIGLAPPFKRMGAKVYDQPSPRCKHLKLFSDAYWACIIRDGEVSIAG